MNWFFKSFTYSIGRKILMALTGLFLVTFLIVHVSGNFLLYAGDNGASFNEFSHFMTHNPIIRIIEIVLFACIILHIIDGTLLWLKNRNSRPVKYATSRIDGGKTWVARNMILTGTIIAIVIVIHLSDFWIPYRIIGNVPDLYVHAKDVMTNPYTAIFYVVAVLLLMLHMYHGFSSAFQTVGIRHPKYYTLKQWTGYILSTIICLGFASMPLYFLLHLDA